MNERKSQIESPMPKHKTNEKNLRIMLVDDEKAICHILDQLLTRDGHKVKTVDNGADAINIVKAEEFNLVLCDLAMPDVYGYDVIESINKLGKRPKIGIMTGWKEQMKPIDDEEFKVDFIIKKPFKHAELRNHIYYLFGADSK